MVNYLVSDYLSSLVPNTVSDVSDYNLRNRSQFQNIPCRANNYAKSFLPIAANIWNSLPIEYTNASSLGCFKRLIQDDNNNADNNNGVYFDVNYGSRFC